MISSGVDKLQRALKVAQQIGFTQRSRAFNNASLYYWGRQYDHLEAWTDEGESALRERKPSVRLSLTKKAVNEIVSHLFGEGKGPAFRAGRKAAGVGVSTEVGAEDEEQLGDAERKELKLANRRLKAVLDASRLETKLLEIGRLGNLHGTVAPAFHVNEGKLFVETLNAGDSFPTFGYEDRARAAELDVDFDDLLELDEYWRSFEETADGEVQTIHRRLWTTEQTIEFIPIEVEDQVEDARELDWIEDTERTPEAHGLGFIPAEWIPNIEIANDIDGRPAVDNAEFSIEDEINYTLSQAGRGVRYNQEPQLVFTNVSNLDETEPIKRGAHNTLTVEADPVAKLPVKAELLELQGSGSAAALEYVDRLRAYFYEMTNVVVHDPDKFAGALSGTALKRLLRPLISFVGLERPQYAAGLARLIQKMYFAIFGEWRKIEVSWPQVVELTTDEIMQVIAAAREAYNSGFILLETAVGLIAPLVGIDDVEEYLDKLKAEAGEGGTSVEGDAAFDEAKRRVTEL